MQYAVDTGKMLREGWMTPGQVGEWYSKALDALYTQAGVFEALGNASLSFGFAALLSIPLMWVACRRLRR